MSRKIHITGLVPAAGASRRMGQDKRLLEYRGKTVLESTVDCLRQGGVDSLMVVLEANSPCQGLAGLQGTITAVNPNPERGMLSSIHEGLRLLPQEADAVAVLPGDHPFVPARAVVALLNFFREHRPLLLIPRYAGKRGHPLMVDRNLLGEALACDDQVGLRQLLQRRQDDVRELALDLPDADQDLDLPEDLWRLRQDR